AGPDGHGAGDAHGVQRLDLVEATEGLEVLREHIVDGLRVDDRGEQQAEGEPAALAEPADDRLVGRQKLLRRLTSTL
ncbi:MAG: hypothetical protein HYZ43_02180, partial [Flavobacteriia bacterium]|nr:hypothetical protein [Flavobacteriia bacterium]